MKSKEIKRAGKTLLGEKKLSPVALYWQNRESIPISKSAMRAILK
jgi:hypothetical protein